jgi:hypothetical protein
MSYPDPYILKVVIDGSKLVLCNNIAITWSIYEAKSSGMSYTLYIQCIVHFL